VEQSGRANRPASVSKSASGKAGWGGEDRGPIETY